MSAWKPLQMPSIKPSRCSSSAVTCSRTAALRKNAVMSLALPSGSSPPEKPPGMTIICAVLTAAAKRSTLSATSALVRLRTMNCSASAPASESARCVSYSQFVPGKTGMSAFGRTCLTAGATRVFVSWEKLSTVPLSRVFVG